MITNNVLLTATEREQILFFHIVCRDQNDFRLKNAKNTANPEIGGKFS